MNGETVKILIEALPYIKKFREKTFVIKYGGSIMKNEKAKKAFIEDVVLMKLVGIDIIIVHGGGPCISSMLDQLNIESRFVHGLRVTDEKAIEVVEMVLSGQINKEIAAALCKHGVSAIGISGRDGHLIEAEKKYIYDGEEKLDIGYVGEVVNINKKLLADLLEKEQLPVISPVGCDIEGKVYNINADYVASAVSTVLEAEKLILLTDIEGIYKDINDPESFISEISIEEMGEYIQTGILKGGMIPKAQCCIDALEQGTKNVHLIDGRKEHSLLLEIFTKEGIGTMIKGREL
ncbi:acetylglutamate kinase [Geosporobacter ferrireducens]|uniref:Acetylglutamate kinase n=1 Tax=Geosporobacter ferrireducens TaxID=1424294 RepID=A0A1D8GHN9_9FIRM|nr:acetylglutamate kinase [Geosporobacter ferrireducens]AOT70396.1 acetylglutamate kinase [Geosporobacter ferrireducens]MTI57238.1 acetylglutamate kinase [Geosporobacter ferrireducens]